ncbi:MAG: PAS domain-containing protein [Candidatus Obscuribacterales bacterium]|nr:PAS domain-containing protein [Steroidobacteraceae bacterium]
MDLDPSTTLRFTLLEDSAVDAELIQTQLADSGLNIVWQHVASEGDFRAALNQDSLPTGPDLVLADYTLPGFDGMSALRIVRERWPDVPFVFVSGSLGEERAIDALKSGATDYVLKERLQRLPAVVRRALTEANEKRERRKAELALEEQRVLLGTLIDNLPDVVYAIDRDEKLTIVNRALLDLVRRQRASVLGHSLTSFRDLADLNEEGESLDSVLLRTGRSQTDRERAVLGKNESLRWWISSKIPLRDHTTGSVVGLVCTSRDVTARRELEQEILEISNREQRRLGSDLHDGLGQELTGLSLLLKGLEVQIARETPAYLPQLSKITELLAHTIQSTRSLARGLAPVNLERGGLPEALRHLAARCTDMYQLNCRFEDRTTRLPELDEGSATHLYRIAQEATTNAARYARAKHIAIELRTTPRKLHLSIADDGIGLSAGLAQGKPGLGLKIMEYRAHMMGGVVGFEEPGVGTRVAFTCPLTLLRSDRNQQRRSA